MLDAKPDSAAHPAPAGRQPPKRLGNGVVQRATIKVLREAGQAMRLAAIHAAVERVLDRPVSIESVSWCLRMDVKRTRLHFERVESGVYRLRAPSTPREG